MRKANDINMLSMTGSYIDHTQIKDFYKVRFYQSNDTQPGENKPDKMFFEFWSFMSEFKNYADTIKQGDKIAIAGYLQKKNVNGKEMSLDIVAEKFMYYGTPQLPAQKQATTNNTKVFQIPKVDPELLKRIEEDEL